MEVSSPVSGSIVIVDDNPNNLKVLGEMLSQAGYKIRAALSGMLALRSIEVNPPDLVLLDIRMPELDGYKVCERLKRDERTRDIPIIFISALHEVEDKVAAFRAGGVDYITKPFQIEEVLARARTHLRLYRLQRHLETNINERTEELRKSYASILDSERHYRAILKQTIQAISLMVEKRDPYTSGHQHHVAGLAVAVAQKLKFDAERLESIRLGAMIHDIGKIHVPAEILNHPGKLDDDKYRLIKAHCEVGYEIVKEVDFPWPVSKMVLQHHERLDGSGYPQGLSGEEIIEEARIIAVVDVMEAMLSHRPYRSALGMDATMAELKAGRGELYDERCVDAVLELVERGAISLGEDGSILVAVE